MDLSEEYWGRKGVVAPLVKFAEKGNLILRSKGQSEWGWLHVSISCNNDTNHPVKYTVVVSANPQLYSSPDYSHFSHHSKTVKEMVFEWDTFQAGVVAWAKEHAGQYAAVPAEDAVLVAWEMFVANYDHWMANFLPLQMQDALYVTLLGERSEKLKAIKEVEDFIKERFERVFLCWKSVKGAIDIKNYADWFAKVVNDMGK